MPAEDLAERLAPALPTLTHPGDNDTPPFLLGGMIFARSMLPPGMLEEEAKELGLPTPDFNKLVLEAIIHLLREQGGVELVDKTELADLRAAAAVNEAKRNAALEFHTPCGTTLRVMVRDFDTQHPQVPCELVKHDCPRTR